MSVTALHTAEATTCPIRLDGGWHLEARACEDCTVALLARLTRDQAEERYREGRVSQDAIEGYWLAWALLSPTGDPDRVSISEIPAVRRTARKLIKARGFAMPAVIA